MNEKEAVGSCGCVVTILGLMNLAILGSKPAG